ncbi:MAG: hypothetical protein CL666_07005 [Balneola sp.]|nr:hypothetical protein [Balneola sp.]|tara:strand:+ start:43407 stop:43592 length:186 start_codon:yes stop_codon:yes gene_type:complete
MVEIPVTETGRNVVLENDKIRNQKKGIVRNLNSELKLDVLINHMKYRNGIQQHPSRRRMLS